MRRLAQARLEPTPDNYARAFAQEAGLPLPETAAPVKPAGYTVPEPPPVPLADWIDRVVKGLERGGRQWTTARKKDSLQRVLSGSRSDVHKLQQRLNQLLISWDRDQPDSTLAELDEDDTPPSGHNPPAGATVIELGLPGPTTAAAPEPLLREAGDPLPMARAPGVLTEVAPSLSVVPDHAPDQAPDLAPVLAAWGRISGRLGESVQGALPPQDTVAEALALELSALTRAVQARGADGAQAEALSEVCARADRVIQHRHHLVAQLTQLCHELAGSLTDLAEDESWARGQCDAMKLRIEEGLTARGIKSVAELLHTTRARQGQLRQEREQARVALKSFIHRMLNELGELGQETGRFHESVGRYAEVIERADTLESLAGVVREMVQESRTVESLVGRAQQRLHDEHARATALSGRVDELERELRRLSDEVSTDQLTQVANRRGLMAAFETERARQSRSGGVLSVALLDVDNFKRLNDELGHGAGDEALKSLAALVARTLRPTDLVARYGGEEFVLLLPDTPLTEAQQVLNRLQRALTGGLFMHENKQVFVTFSAGVTDFREGEALEQSLERADQALYEAKRTGKNRSCIA